MKTVLITGVGSGLGEALAHRFLDEGWHVVAIGRHCSGILQNHPDLLFFPLDLSKTYLIEEHLKELVSHRVIDIAILNAGMLGSIKPLRDTTIHELETIMHLNVWANKTLIDTLCTYTVTRQVVAISSGASINGSKGWGGYSISKAALNMLVKVYAKEYPRTHFSALAPGVIDTPMVRTILQEADEARFPSVTRLKNGPIQTPEEAAKRLFDTFPKLTEFENGSYIDIRTMSE